MEPLSLLAAGTIPIAIAYAWLRKAPLSLTLAVAILVVFLLGVVAQAVDLSNGGAFYLDLEVWKSGSNHAGPLSYITMMFLHAGLLHLIFNLAFLILLGPMLEERIGPLRWGVLYFTGGIVATLVFEAVHWYDPQYFLLGASGALSAVFGAFGRLYPRERISMLIPLPVPIPPQPAIYWVVGFIVVQFGLWALSAGNSILGIAWEAHIAGLAFGFAVAPLVMRIPVRRRMEPARVRDFSVLRPIVQGRELEEIYDMLSKETLPEAQDAWLERFSRKAKCPECGKPLQWVRGAFRSDCGWRLRVR